MAGDGYLQVGFMSGHRLRLREGNTTHQVEKCIDVIETIETKSTGPAKLLAEGLEW